MSTPPIGTRHTVRPAYSATTYTRSIHDEFAGALVVVAAVQGSDVLVEDARGREFWINRSRLVAL